MKEDRKIKEQKKIEAQTINENRSIFFIPIYTYKRRFYFSKEK